MKRERKGEEEKRKRKELTKKYFANLPGNRLPCLFLECPGSASRVSHENRFSLLEDLNHLAWGATPLDIQWTGTFLYSYSCHHSSSLYPHSQRQQEHCPSSAIVQSGVCAPLFFRRRGASPRGKSPLRQEFQLDFFTFFHLIPFDQYQVGPTMAKAIVPPLFAPWTTLFFLLLLGQTSPAHSLQ